MVSFGKLGLMVSLILFSLTVAIIISRRRKLGFAVLLICYGACFLWIHSPRSGEVTMFDVGQGDSFLIRTPRNQSVNLIDTGGKLNFNTQKWQQRTPSYQAEHTAINYLKSIGINTIDNLYITHQDADHCGDLPAYLQKMHVKNIVVAKGMETNNSFLNRLKLGTFENLISITDHNLITGQPLSCYYPDEPGEGKNEDSLVLGGVFGQQRWLFTGDLDRENELRMVRRYPKIKADIIKVGHHGSKTASDPAFIKQLTPAIAWISAGKNNRYNHPNSETITTLNQNKIRIMNTQQSGMVQYSYQQFQRGIFKSDSQQRREATHGLLNF